MAGSRLEVMLRAPPGQFGAWPRRSGEFNCTHAAAL